MRTKLRHRIPEEQPNVIRNGLQCVMQNDIHRGFNNEYLLAHMGVILNLLACLTSCLAIIIILV